MDFQNQPQMEMRHGKILEEELENEEEHFKNNNGFNVEKSQAAENHITGNYIKSNFQSNFSKQLWQKKGTSHETSK